MQQRPYVPGLQQPLQQQVPQEQHPQAQQYQQQPHLQQRFPVQQFPGAQQPFAQQQLQPTGGPLLQNQQPIQQQQQGAPPALNGIPYNAASFGFRTGRLEQHVYIEKLRGDFELIYCTRVEAPIDASLKNLMAYNDNGYSVGVDELKIKYQGYMRVNERTNERLMSKGGKQGPTFRKAAIRCLAELPGYVSTPETRKQTLQLIVTVRWCLLVLFIVQQC